MTTIEEREVWTTPAGLRVYLTPVAGSPPEDGEGWYADFPGQRPPQTYELVSVVTGEVLEDRTVFPVEPWNWYDCISDELIREGYTPPPATEAEQALCEHGLSAQLCAGPMHYPDDRYDR